MDALAVVKNQVTFLSCSVVFMSAPWSRQLDHKYNKMGTAVREFPLG